VLEIEKDIFVAPQKKYIFGLGKGLYNRDGANWE